jgi:glycosyltransferase 2 family protein
MSRVPVAGNVVGNLFVACQVMSRRPERLIPAFALGVTVHLLLVMSFHSVAVGLPLAHPSLGDHFCIVPLAETAGAIPITPGGLGTTEAALGGLYAAVGADANSGVIVALGQRLVMLTAGIAAIGYYLTQRQSVDAAIHEAEAMA